MKQRKKWKEEVKERRKRSITKTPLLLFEALIRSIFRIPNPGKVENEFEICELT